MKNTKLILVALGIALLALNAAAANVSFAEIESDKGHDAFLLEEPEFWSVLSGFLDGAREHFGLDFENGA